MMGESAKPALNPHAEALSGIVVLDFSHVIAGPFATYYLAALGARVIKVENPQRGDAIRNKPLSFTSLNHGKEYLSLDLNLAADLAEAKQLASSADIMVDNMRPGVLAKFGLGEPEVRASNPRLIHCSISGYGSQGEWAQRPAYDHVIQAASGMTLMGGMAEDDPIKVGFPVIDSAAGILAALGMVAAVRRRDLSGQGESLDISMLGAALQLMYTMTVETMASGQAPTRIGNAGYSKSPAAQTFACTDGFIAVGANTPQQVRKMAEVLGLDSAIKPLLVNETNGFVGDSHGDTIKTLFAQAISKRSATELEQSLNAVQVGAAKVRDLAQCVADCRAAQALEAWTLHAEQEVTVPGLGFRARGLYGGNSRPSWPFLSTVKDNA